jgi:RCC1 and BTB domain-containing protein
MFTPPYSGKGAKGQLGHGNLNNATTFTKVEGLEGKEIRQVACGDDHSVVLTSEGFVYTFGSNKCGQIGHGITEGNQSTPKRVTGFLESKKVVFIATNGYHSACITDDGGTYTWGEGEYGQLGHGDDMIRSTPTLVEGLAGKKVMEVACGGYHTIVRTDDGRVYSFGFGEHGQLGHGSSESKLTPSLIHQAQFEEKCVVQVVCGWVHSMALTSDGSIYTWGYGKDGQLGHGSELNSDVPSIVESLIGYKVFHISSSNAQSVALIDSKRHYAKEMKAMIDDETCSDVVFLLKGGERAHANKGLLIGRSEYFRAMFRSGMKESRENQVEVRDCSKSVFLLLLEYLYSGEIDIGMGDAIELYALSDRYQEDDLSRQCLEVIEIGLSDTNAIELLVEVDGLGLVALKDACMGYVVSNYGESIKRETVDSLSRSLMAELLINIAENSP